MGVAPSAETKSAPSTTSAAAATAKADDLAKLAPPENKVAVTPQVNTASNPDAFGGLKQPNNSANGAVSAIPAVTTQEVVASKATTASNTENKATGGQEGPKAFESKSAISVANSGLTAAPEKREINNENKTKSAADERLAPKPEARNTTHATDKQDPKHTSLTETKQTTEIRQAAQRGELRAITSPENAREPGKTSAPDISKEQTNLKAEAPKAAPTELKPIEAVKNQSTPAPSQTTAVAQKVEAPIQPVEARQAPQVVRQQTEPTSPSASNQQPTLRIVEPAVAKPTPTTTTTNTAQNTVVVTARTAQAVVQPATQQKVATQVVQQQQVDNSRQNSKATNINQTNTAAPTTKQTTVSNVTQPKTAVTSTNPQQTAPVKAEQAQRNLAKETAGSANAKLTNAVKENLVVTRADRVANLTREIIVRKELLGRILERAQAGKVVATPNTTALRQRIANVAEVVASVIKNGAIGETIIALQGAIQSLMKMVESLLFGGQGKMLEAMLGERSSDQKIRDLQLKKDEELRIELEQQLEKLIKQLEDVIKEQTGTELDFADLKRESYDMSGCVKSLDNGQGVAGVSIYGGHLLGTAVSDFNGEFTFNAVPVGTNYSIVLRKPGYLIAPSTVSGIMSGPVTHHFRAENERVVA